MLLSAQSVTLSTSSRGWASVLGLSVDQLTTWGVLYYSYGVLAAPMARDMGVSSRFVAGAFSLALLVSAVLARRVGRVLDREGPRVVLLAGATVGTLTFAGLGVVRGEVAVLLAFAALGAAQSLGLYEPAFRAIVGWFPEERERSRALLVLTSVAGLASTVFLPLSALLVNRFGSRTTALILASLVAVVTIPVRLALPPPASGQGNQSSLPTPGSAPVAHLLGAGFALQSFASTGATLYLVSHLLDRGEPMARAALIAGLAGAAQVPGRLLWSPLQRAVGTGLRLPLLLVVQAGALLGIAIASGAPALVAIAVFGAAGGTMTLERASVTVEWFGRDDFGAWSGRIASTALLARAGSPYALEVLHGITSYAVAFGVLAVVLVGGALMVVLADRFRSGRNAG